MLTIRTREEVEKEIKQLRERIEYLQKELNHIKQIEHDEFVRKIEECGKGEHND